MNCQEAEIRLVRRLDGELGPAEPESLAQHLASCVACRELETGLTADREVLQAIAAEDVSEEALGELRRRVMQHIPERRPKRMWWFPVAAAAAVLLGIFAWPRATVEPPPIPVAKVKPPASAYERSKPHTVTTVVARAPRRRPVTPAAVKETPLFVKLETPDPDVVIYWMVEPKEGSE